MFEDDICRCADSDKCPYKKSCLRATPKVGIYTMSYFYKDIYSLEDEHCEFYIDKEKYYAE